MILRLFIVFLLPLCAIAQNADNSVSFTERTPAYFTDHYGTAKSSKNVTKYIFLQPTRGNVGIKGQFSIREFKKGELSVEAIFNLPSLKLAAASFSLPHPWTPEQIQAALLAYGADWKQTSPNSVVKVWTSVTGFRAISYLHTLEIQSPSIVQEVELTLKDTDAKGKAIPRF